MKRVYLAGPDVMFPGARKRAEELKDILRRHGLEGVFPLDADIEFEPDESSQSRGHKIFEANVELLKACDGVLANICAFRSPSADAGTAWEMGYASALGKPVVCYGADDRDYRDRVEEGGAAFLVDDSIVEDFGFPDNLMLFCSSHGWWEGTTRGIDNAAREIASLLGR